MKLKFDRAIVDMDDEPIKDEKDRPVLLSQVCIEALLRVAEGDNKLSGEEKLERFQLAKKLKKHTEVDMSAEQVAKLKKLIPQHFSTVVVGQALTMLEGE